MLTVLDYYLSNGNVFKVMETPAFANYKFKDGKLYLGDKELGVVDIIKRTILDGEIYIEMENIIYAR